MPACSENSGQIVDGTVIIIDAKGLGLKLVTGKVKQYMDLSSKISQNYYPEILHKMFIINTSFIFNMLWSLAKGFIDARTRKKIVIKKEDFLDELMEQIDLDNLPEFLGGNCTCSEFGGCMLSDAGPWKN